MSPLVSVVMPVRNESVTVGAAVASVLEQTMTDLEILVIDGASSDDTAQQVSALAAADPRVRLLHNPARTIPHALNVALAASAGRYVARVDAHARVSDTYLERAVAELETRPDVAAVGGRRIGVATTATGRAVAAALSSPFGVGNSINHYATTRQDTDHASFGVFRADVLRSVGGWDEQLLVNEDVDLDHRILGQGHGIRFDPDMCIYWHVRESVRDFGHQYRRYGRGKAAMVRKNGPSALRGRHLVAPALVGALGVAAGLVVTGHSRLAGAIVTPYAVGVGAASVHTWRADDTADAPSPVRLGGAFVAMHLSWGLGFLEGYVLGLRPAAASAR